MDEQKNPAHEVITRAEFDALLEASPRWQAIIEYLKQAAYDDLRIAEVENGGEVGIFITTIIGVRAQDLTGIRISHFNFLVEGKKGN